MKLGDKIMRLRTEKGLSQDILSIELDVSKTALRKWELNESKPNIDNLMKICDFFETDLYSLLENVENVDFSHSKFDGNNYVINPTNSTINFSDNREIIHSLMKNQELISKLVEKQEVFLNKLIMKKY